MPKRRVEFDVRVIPRARTSEVGGLRGSAVVIRLAAPPVDGAANDALIAFLKDRLDVPRRAIQILSGERSRRKRVAIDGIAADVVAERLGVSLPISST